MRGRDYRAWSLNDMYLDCLDRNRDTRFCHTAISQAIGVEKIYNGKFGTLDSTAALELETFLTV